MTFLMAMLYIFYFILIIIGVEVLFLFFDWIIKEYPIIGILLIFISGFLLLSFGVWAIGNL